MSRISRSLALLMLVAPLEVLADPTPLPITSSVMVDGLVEVRGNVIICNPLLDNCTMLFKTVDGDKLITYDNPTNSFFFAAGVGASQWYYIEGTPGDGFQTYLLAEDPTSDNLITFPDATGTVALLSDVFTPTDLDTDYGDEYITSTWDFQIGTLRIPYEDGTPSNPCLEGEIFSETTTGVHKLWACNEDNEWYAAAFPPTTIDSDYGDETVTSIWDFSGAPRLRIPWSLTACNGGDTCAEDGDICLDTSVRMPAVCEDGSWQIGGWNSFTPSASVNSGNYWSFELAGALELPNSSTLPGGFTCDDNTDSGRVYFDTDAPSGQRFYGCEGAGGWVVQGDGYEPNTNAETICTGTTTYLDGEGGCDAIDVAASIATHASLSDAHPARPDSRCWYIESPGAESFDELYYFMDDITITRVWCETDANTADVNVENSSDTSVLSAELVCDVGGQTSCASGCDVDTIQLAQDNISQYGTVNVDISAVSGPPGKVSVCVGYTVD